MQGGLRMEGDHSGKNAWYLSSPYFLLFPLPPATLYNTRGMWEPMVHPSNYSNKKPQTQLNSSLE